MGRIKDTLMEALYAMHEHGMSVEQMAVVTCMSADDIRWILDIEEK